MPNNKTAARGGLWTRDFLLVWQGMAESRIGSVLYSIAIGIWVYNKTGSATLMGFMTSLSYFGALVLQPFGGALADRCSKRALMIGSDAVCGVAMLALGGLALCGAMQVWQVLAVAAVSAVCTALFQPAVNSLIPQLVPAGDLLRRPRSSTAPAARCRCWATRRAVSSPLSAACRGLSCSTA